MKPIAILYATREGQTEKIADRISLDFARRGARTFISEVSRVGSIDLTAYSYVILAASVHAGHHEREMVAFVKSRLADLEKVPTAFVSVTLSQAGVQRPTSTPEQREQFAQDVDHVISAFIKETGWHPSRVKPVAGALVYRQYNPFIRFLMRRIARKAGADTDTSRDYEYTDWIDLDRFVDEIVDQFTNEDVRAHSSCSLTGVKG